MTVKINTLLISLFFHALPGCSVVQECDQVIYSSDKCYELVRAED